MVGSLFARLADGRYDREIRKRSYFTSILRFNLQIEIFLLLFTSLILRRRARLYWILLDLARYFAFWFPMALSTMVYSAAPISLFLVYGPEGKSLGQGFDPSIDQSASVHTFIL